MARYHHITSLENITNYYDTWRDEQGKQWTNGFTVYDVQRQLDYLNLKGWCINNADESWIRWAVKENLGCVVGLQDYPHQGDLHAVVLTELNDKEVKFVDSNSPGYLWIVSLEWFRSHWSGFFICLEKPK